MVALQQVAYHVGVPASVATGQHVQRERPFLGEDILDALAVGLPVSGVPPVRPLDHAFAQDQVGQHGVGVFAKQVGHGLRSGTFGPYRPGAGL